jgi:putative tryptophan/tyrosine transport system substrate-binding protein
MRRREFIVGLAGAAAWPGVARAQQTTIPLVGYLASEQLTDARREILTAFKRGLADAGYIEGRNVIIEYYSADGQNDRLPALARELVRRQVSLIEVAGTPAALAAKAATTTIPIVFNLGSDPVQVGLVASMNQPGGNITGITNIGVELTAKRLEVLHQVVPTTKSIGILTNRTNPIASALIVETQTAARALGINSLVVDASSQEEITAAFAKFADVRVGALLVSADTLFIAQVNQLVALAAYTKIPASYEFRLFPAAGGLMSLGPNLLVTERQSGVYAGRILKGEKPADLPVQQATKFELIINMKTAKSLGLTIPETVLAIANEIIE